MNVNWKAPIRWTVVACAIALSIIGLGTAARMTWAHNNVTVTPATADTTVGPMVAVDTTMTDLKAPQPAARVFEVEITDREGHHRTVVITVEEPERVDSVEAGAVNQ